MDELVERVAQAICKSRTCEGVSCCQWPANLGRTKCPVKEGGYDDAARAAIETLKKIGYELKRPRTRKHSWTYTRKPFSGEMAHWCADCSEWRELGHSLDGECPVHNP